MTKRTRKIVIIASMLLAVPAVAYAGLMTYFFVGPAIAARINAEDFDSEKWKARALDGDVRWPTRLRMVDDLLESRVLAGASRVDAIRLLGQPDDTSYFRDWSMVYWLGPERGPIRIDSEWLVLRLDDRGVVKEIRIVRD